MSAAACSSDPEQVFLDHLPLVEELIRSITRRHRCAADEAEEFASLVKEKLWENGYDRIRSFQGKGGSSFTTYLNVVAQRLFIDFRRQNWGKWRASAEAVRQGEVAIRLEELIVRDGRTFEDACQILSSSNLAGTSRQELERIAASLPVRRQRRLAGEEELASVAAGGPRPEDRVLERELAPAQARVRGALERALASLPGEDRLVLRLRIERGLKVSTIADSLCLPQKATYRRLERILRDLRKSLESQGISREQVGDILSREEVDWGFGAGQAGAGRAGMSAR